MLPHNLWKVKVQITASCAPDGRLVELLRCPSASQSLASGTSSLSIWGWRSTVGWVVYEIKLNYSLANTTLLLNLSADEHKSSSGDEIPERDVTYHFLCLLIYHWTTTDLWAYFQNILSRPNDNCYLSNGRRSAKSALRILLLSTSRVSINYFFASSLP